MLPLLLLIASEGPPPTELVGVSFAKDAATAVVETRWVLDGPGFPVARVEALDVATGARRWAEEVRLGPADASLGMAEATSRARAKAGEAYTALALQPPAAAEACGPAGCGAEAGCGGVEVPVKIATTPVAGETCPAGWVGTTPSVEVAGRAAVLTAERPTCASDWAPSALYRQGSAAVLVLRYRIPGHEGPAERFTALAARLP